MKKFLKSFLSLVCVCALLITPTINTAFAATNSAPARISLSQKDLEQYLNISDAEKASILRSYGLAEEEIQYYVWRESKNNPNRITFGPNITTSHDGISLQAFPKNPKIGDTYVQKFRIPAEALGLAGVLPSGVSVQEIAAALAKKQIPILACYALAATIASLYASYQGYKGYEITIEYMYTYDNDGFANWVYGPTTVKGYK
ncbi:hypothetical protein [Clostridium minihomine]|uniref:hypothetical protein n=1 Tax=Clostridium minihomine TaxID=2045012 RepID=UPI000C775225|nr:hypothetical protein [Clostridium minihomine]